jgi:chorismate synthase
MSNITGRRFRVATWGESHGPAVGAVVDGCPAGLPVSEADIDRELARDVPLARIGTSRVEPNRVQLLSGVFEGRTLGTPISLLIANEGVRSEFYEHLRGRPRPGHGDLTYRARYGHTDWRGGSRASGRECIARLAAGAIARALLTACGVTVRSEIVELAGVRVGSDEELAHAVARATHAKEKEGGATGGIVKVSIAGVPAGLGGPVFAKLEADLASGIMGIGGVKSFSMGLGSAAARMTAPEFNDEIVVREGRLGTRTNRAGGVLAGISTGEDVWFEFAVKPTPSIRREQHTVDLETMEPVLVSANGHFDANFTPRAAVVGEAMAALIVVDHMMEFGLVHPTRFDLSPALEKPSDP